MKILTSTQMKVIDRRTIEEVGIPGPVLMENAGLQIFRSLKEIYPDLAVQRIVVVAGKGNNGGDGLVVARHLLDAGASPTVLVLCRIEDLQGDAALNARIGRNIGLNIKEVLTLEEWKKQRAVLLHAEGVHAEEEGPPPVVVSVEEDLDLVVAADVVAVGAGGADHVAVGLVRPDAEVDRGGAVPHEHLGLLLGGA